MHDPRFSPPIPRLIDLELAAGNTIAEVGPGFSAGTLRVLMARASPHPSSSTPGSGAAT